ncbi:MAG: hypothetical protein SP1CHLAM54_15320 [Chlamydiia bacterium]|nr:hypothetical protein [Chlamydiia bacterium]MCH9616422.1 hypothetical protein [Chlamydiia bacterium]MCH9629592.1 hypothetical protein [Chlamydiia bacterium]
MKKAVIISISSDIGLALADKWLLEGYEVHGTYRTMSDELATRKNLHLYHCDLSDKHSVQEAIAAIDITWDTLVLAPGHLEPIGNFDKVDFDAWEESMQVNLLAQLRIVHGLLPKRSQTKPTVLFFAGGGTNNAVLRYSSYTLSKIALIKMCELLDAEIPDTRFVIVGPGVVKTKIHEPTLRLGEKAAGQNYQRTVDRLKNNECTPMEDVVECCHYLTTTSCTAVSGRNFSTAGDNWGDETLEKQLQADHDMYKLRRAKNDWS